MRTLQWWAVMVLLAAGLATGRAVGAEVVLIRGSSAAPNAGERTASERLADLLGRWLTEMGIAHDVIADTAMGAKTLSGARVVILGYHPNPTARTLNHLRQVRKLGGKLIVCYGGDAQLAEIMKVKLGGYRAAAYPGNWSAFRFHPEALPHLPERVAQTSRNIRLVEPIAGASRVIAFWEDLAGKSTGDPAWLQSDAGFWMTHVLLDDGDIAHKQQALLAMIASVLPEVWRGAAARSVAQAGVIGRFNGMEAILTQTERLAEARGNKAVLQELAKARALHARILYLHKAQQDAEVVARCRDLQALLVNAYGRVQTPVVPEVRLVWDHTGEGVYPGDWRRTMHVLAASGVTDLLVDVLWPGSAHYASTVVASSDVFRRHGDQLAPALKAARASGVRLHAWKILWNLDRATPEFMQALQAEGRLQVTDAGKAIPWLCPSDERNVQMEKDALRELVARYDVDGLHLDYVRYRDWHSCYCKGCRERFEAHLGRKLGKWPEDVRAGVIKAPFRAWRAGVMTRFVQDVSALARQRRPKIQLSAAVFGKYPQSIDSVGQDWGLWLKEGYLDFVCPMNYTDDLRAFAALLEGQMALPGAKGRIYPGIGVNARESRLSAVDVIDQIRLTRRTAAGGFALFDLNRRLETEILPVLRLGVMSAR